ncbi:hypothetical protein M231_06843 [Tremella mesenterica]|uniref:OPA3-like protein n=1 Tax=Tremella mesenterica TaxID=5217 RepID=A0A4Q1BAP7_TREME|nr:uncharacterized protein TREMEDRAFT_73990 [Tremella mesenterica DSM 1558]EIW68995.1 hypothetical protein TREMEDRAFT_73990 [Tremella mesenterica DSM 1558]RXK35879.1 hypothetical protein M231_06843 [Tremella mesenterica]
MASAKILTLAIRTLAKPISTTIKNQAAEHPTFRSVCIGLAQSMHRTEARMRLGLLNEEAKNIKPLNDVRAIQNGATFLAESFLFLVGAGLIVGETWRSSRKETRRRDEVHERLDNLEEDVKSIRGLLESATWREGVDDLRERSEKLERVLETVISNGLKAGWLGLGHSDESGEGLPLLQMNRSGREVVGHGHRIDLSSRVEVDDPA